MGAAPALVSASGSPPAALLPAPADLALGRGPGLLAAANGKQTGFKRQGVQGPGGAPSPPPADLRQTPGPCGPASPGWSPGCSWGEGPSLDPQPPSTHSWLRPSSSDSPAPGLAGPGQPCAEVVSVVRRAAGTARRAPPPPAPGAPLRAAPQPARVPATLPGGTRAPGSQAPGAEGRPLVNSPSPWDSGPVRPLSLSRALAARPPGTAGPEVRGSPALPSEAHCLPASRALGWGGGREAQGTRPPRPPFWTAGWGGPCGARDSGRRPALPAAPRPVSCGSQPWGSHTRPPAHTRVHMLACTRTPCGTARSRGPAPAPAPRSRAREEGPSQGAARRQREVLNVATPSRPGPLHTLEGPPWAWAWRQSAGEVAGAPVGAGFPGSGSHRQVRRPEAPGSRRGWWQTRPSPLLPCPRPP